MVDFVKMLSHRKGDASTYRPTAGTVCLISGPNCDNDNGYTYGEFEVLWTDDLFILYRKAGCWPVINKWEHIRSKPLDSAPPAPAPAIQAQPLTDAAIVNELARADVGLQYMHHSDKWTTRGSIDLDKLIAAIRAIERHLAGNAGAGEKA